MSPRRRSGLSKDDLEALEHLPAVLRALEHLAQEHAKVRSLMAGPQTIVVDHPPGLPPPRPLTGGHITLPPLPAGLESETARREAQEARAAAEAELARRQAEATPEQKEAEDFLRSQEAPRKALLNAALGIGP